MKNPTNSNMYQYAAASIAERYEAHLSGDFQGLFCVVSAGEPSDAAANAMKSSANSLGYGAQSCVFVQLESQGQWLTDDDLFSIIEGIEPLAIVALDISALQALGLAYRVEFPPCTPLHLLGRLAVGFEDFPAMLASPGEKQKAWAALKSLKL